MFCAEYSRNAEEQLFGTAKPIDLWVLIEHRGRWERKAEESLPAEARTAVDRLRADFPRTRLALIRRNGPPSSTLSCFLALSRETHSRLFSFSIEHHHDLESLDFQRILHAPPSESKLILVCTHGTHDRCCAKFGHSLHEAMQHAAGDAAWQVSHVSGCRFAPNVVCLPQGIVYGRVQTRDCRPIVDAAHTGEIIPRLLRGRSCYPKPVQSAEYFARTEFNEAGPLHLLDATEEHSGQWQVVFRRAAGTISLRLMTATTGVLTFKSCSAAEGHPRVEFRLIDCRCEPQPSVTPGREWRGESHYGM